MKNIAIFASGSGTNAENIISIFNDHKKLNIVGVYSNRKDAEVLNRAAKFNVDAKYYSPADFKSTDGIYRELIEKEVDLIVLAGFLMLVPEHLVNRFDIINIHPSLMPKYCGKGMYGDKVHQAVIQNNEIETGITIHWVDLIFDHGEHIFQKKCSIDATDTYQEVAKKVHQLEYKYFPQVIEHILLGDRDAMFIEKE